MEKCRKAVEAREATKSDFVRVLNKIRDASRTLAKAMVKEGKLPREDLIYFLTFPEIGDLLDEPKPLLISK